MNKIFIIAEAGVNHNGSYEIAIKLCDAAKAANADAIKFQTWNTDLIITKRASLATYQGVNIGNEVNQYQMAKELELSYDQFLKIKSYCDNIGIMFLSTPDDEESLRYLLSLGMNLIKVGSGEITNIPYLRILGSVSLPIILSTGMSNLGDVERAIQILTENGAPEISLLHCTTNYPCPMHEVNLNAMITLGNAFKCKIGYSDHTEGIEVAIAAAALGAQIVEKHFTLDKSMPGPDHMASLDPMELTNMVKAIRNIEIALGDGVKRSNQSENIISKVVLKRIVAKKRITKGELLSDHNITVKRTDSGLSALLWDLIIGSTAKISFEADDSISFNGITIPDNH